MIDRKERTVFVSGISYDSKEEKIRELFQDCGTIEYLNLPRYQDTNRLMGYCHITFKDIKATEQALKRNKSVLDNRYLEISKAKGVKSKRPLKTQEEMKKLINKETKTIFVKNLPYDITEDDLGDFFSKCGKIETVRFVYNNKKNYFKGFAYVDFMKHTSLYTAIKMNGKLFKGRALVVDIDSNQRKHGFRFNMKAEGNSKYNHGFFKKNSKHQTQKN